MAGYGEQLLDRIEKMVEEFESNTSVELVLVLARRSERYRDIPYKTGCGLALAVLAALIYLPVSFRADFLILDAVLAFAVGYLIGRTSPILSRVLTGEKRRAAAVRRAAESAFVSQGVALTCERTGLLVYLSRQERRVEVLWDAGIEKCLPAPEWNAARRAAADVNVFEGFPDSLRRFMALLNAPLACHLPRAADDVDEVSNRPVVME